MIEYRTVSELRKFKAEIFRALSHPSRIHILDTLRNGEKTVNQICDELELQGPNVSQQLALLRNTNLVNARKEGNNVYYSIKDPTLFKLLDVCKRIFDNHLIDFKAKLDEIAIESN